MLVLSRRLNESIVIDDRITITVVAVDGTQVRLGLEAPKEVPIFRKELLVGLGVEAGHRPNQGIAEESARTRRSPQGGK